MMIRPLQEAREALTNNDTPPSSPPPRKNNNNLIIGGMVAVVLLIIVGLLLPPISLGSRLGLGGDDADNAAPTAVAGEPTMAAVTSIPGEFETSASGVSVSLADAAEYGATLPAGFTIKGSVYRIDGSGSGNVRITAPAAAQPLTAADLYAYDGSSWAFVPTTVAAGVFTSGDGPLAAAYAVVEPAAAQQRLIGAELLPGQTLDEMLAGAINELSAGTLTLMADGTLGGAAVEAPAGSFSQFLRTTNAGAFVDQASLQALLADPALQSSHVTALADAVSNGSFAGLNLDYQGVAPAQQDAFSAFVAELGAALRTRGARLAVTISADQLSDGSWTSGGQDWGAIGQAADSIYLRLPLDPAAYADGGAADQLAGLALRQVARQKLTLLVNAGAVDAVGGNFRTLSNSEALATLGELQASSDEVEPGTAVDLALSGSPTPLAWDLDSVAYSFQYMQAEQEHTVWLGNAAGLNHRLRFANSYNLRGAIVTDLGGVDLPAPYVTALNSFLGISEPPQPDPAGIVWTISDEDGGVVASATGDTANYSWADTETPGIFTVSVDFAQGETVTQLGTVAVTVVDPAAAAAPEEAPEEEEENVGGGGDATATPPPLTFGDADGVVNVGANVRTGPSVAYPTLAGGAEPGTRVQIIGRNAANSWYNIVLPSTNEGWIFAQLVNLNPAFDLNSVGVVEVEPPVTGGGGSGDSGGGSTGPPPPVASGNLQLGGHIFGAPYGVMSSAGMTWVKKQVTWGPGKNPNEVAGIINEAHAAGFKVLIGFAGGTKYPSNIDFGGFVEFLRGVAALGPDAIEVWNEPNIDFEWPNGQIDPNQYVTQMLAPAYQAIKSVNPNVLVISGALAPTGVNGAGVMSDDLYLAGMAAAGAASYMDCIGAHHNAGATAPGASSGHPAGTHYSWYFLPTMNLYYNSFGGARQVCFTEAGYVTAEGMGYSLPSNFSWGANITLAQQAQWLAEAVSLAANSGRVRIFIVWNIDNTSWNGVDPQNAYAIIRPDGGCPACATLASVMGR